MYFKILHYLRALTGPTTDGDRRVWRPALGKKGVDSKRRRQRAWPVGLLAMVLGAFPIGDAGATLYSVSFESDAGLSFEGVIDSKTDTFTVTSTKAPALDATGAGFLGINLPASGPVRLVARTPGSSSVVSTVPGSTHVLPNFDIPDDWDGSLGRDSTGAPFVFVSEWELRAYRWDIPDGAFGALDSSTHLIWGGDSEGDTWTMDGLYHFPMVYIDSSGRQHLGLEDYPIDNMVVTIAAPEPATITCGLLGLGLLVRRRRR